MTKLLYLSYIWPEPESSAAGWRTLQLLEALRGEYAITVGSPATENAHSERLRALGYETRVCAPNDPAFDAFVGELRPAVVVFDRFMLEEMFGWRVKEAAPDAIRIIDTQDLHSLRRARESGADWRATEDFSREIAAIARSHLSLVLSSHEMALLRELGLPESILLELPFFHDPREERARPAFAGRAHVAMIGNFRHPPNADSVRWLRDTLWPAVRARRSDIEVHLYGAYPPKEMMALDSPYDGFRVKGPAPNAIETLARYRASLAPLRYGAGIKGKIFDSWVAGTPVVATATGIEGMADGGASGALVFDSPETFADSIIRVYDSAAESARLAREGAEILRTRYDRGVLARRLLDRTRALAEGRGQPGESRYWLRSILWREQLRSAKYFSKWIEEKEKGRDA